VTAAKRSPRLSRAILVGRRASVEETYRATSRCERAAIDDVVVSEALNGTEQLVLLGAGFDAPPLGASISSRRRRSYEIDFRARSAASETASAIANRSRRA